MANYGTLITSIQDNIKQNGQNLITGELLQQALLSMITELGAEFQFGGDAKLTPTQTDPGTPDYNVAYIASEPGTYSNFGGLVVENGEVAVFKWDGSWSKEITGIAPTTEIARNRNVINISELFPTGGTGGTNVYATRADARAMCTVASGLRKLGAIVTYLTPSGWVLEEFVGTNTSNWNSTTQSVWRDLTDGSNVYVYTMESGESRADVRNKVPLANRKTGAMVVYFDGLAWCIDQFINADVSTWSSSLYGAYWANLLKAGKSADKAHSLQYANGLSEQGISVTGTPGTRGAVYTMTLESAGMWVLSFKFKFPRDVQQATGDLQLAKLDNLGNLSALGGFAIDIFKALPTAQAPFAQPYFGAGLNFYPVLSKTNNYGSRFRPTGAANKQFVGKDAVSIRYAGDITQAANRDVVLTISNTGLVVKHSTNDAVIVSEPFPASKSMNEWAATLAAKCASGGAYAGIIDFDYLLVEGFSTDDLLRVSNIPLVGDYSEQSAAKGWQAFPCFLPYYDDEWHTIDVRMDWSKADIRNALTCIYDGMEMSVTASLVQMNANANFEATFTLGGSDILVKDLSFKTNTTKTSAKKIIVGMTHQQADGVYNPATPDGYMTIGRMQWLLDAFKRRGYEFVGLEDIAAYIAAGKDVPDKCFTIIFDDKYYFENWDNALSNKFRRLLMANNAKASFAIAPAAIDTDAKKAAINADKPIFQFHAHDTTNPTADKYGYADFMTHYAALFAAHRAAIGATNIYTYAGGKYDPNLLHLFAQFGICYCSLVGGNYMSYVNASGVANVRRVNTFTAKAFDPLAQPRLSIDDDDLTEERLAEYLDYMDSI